MNKQFVWQIWTVKEDRKVPNPLRGDVLISLFHHYNIWFEPRVGCWNDQTPGFSGPPQRPSGPVPFLLVWCLFSFGIAFLKPDKNLTKPLTLVTIRWWVSFPWQNNHCAFPKFAGFAKKCPLFFSLGDLGSTGRPSVLVHTWMANNLFSMRAMRKSPGVCGIPPGVCIIL